MSSSSVTLPQNLHIPCTAEQLLACGLRVPEDVGEQAGHAIMHAISSGGVEQHCLPLSLIERRSSNPTLPEQPER